MGRELDGASSSDLLVVGPGVLGSVLGKQWKEAYPSARVVGQTNTESSHARLAAMGLEPRTGARADGTKFPFVAFAAPPSGSDDYLGSVRAALDLWDGTGSFVFTSSAGVYTTNDGSAADEDGDIVPMGASPRTDRLLATEDAVLAAGGNVVRLVGLYHAERGAHTYFMKIGKVERPANYLVNLLHYEDAAGISASVLAATGADGAGFARGRVFLGCDNTPVTFTEMMAAVGKADKFAAEAADVEFVGDTEPQTGKRMNNDKTRAALEWEPRYSSIGAFFEATNGCDFYTESGFF